MLGVLGDGGAHSRHVKERAEEVRAFLEENPTRDIDILGVARANSLSPFYLTRIFKAHYGVPPYLHVALLGGPVSVEELEAAAKDAAHSWSTVKRAKADLGVVSSKAGFGGEGRWEWELP